MTKTFLGKIIAGVGDFFKHLAEELFNSAEKAFKALPATTQQQIKDGTGIMALLGQMLDDAPQDILNAILTTFPTLTNSDLDKGFEALIQIWNLSPASSSLQDKLAAIVAHLKPKQGSLWASVMNEGANLLADILSGGSLFQIIVVVMQYVFETFVEGKIVPPAKSLNVPTAPQN